jgi:uncharacterized protein
VEQLTFIGQFIWQNFLQIWPYLLITIPLAVAVNVSGASRYIDRAFQASPILAIFLATVVGAFSPFCSCTVIPVVASLLISGVPLAPVMAFWIASPSMDPEIFFLSVGFLGWELALWRLGGTFVLSLGAGLLTHFVMVRGWLGRTILRQNGLTGAFSTRRWLSDGWRRLSAVFIPKPTLGLTAVSAPIHLSVTAVSEPTQSVCCASACGDDSCALPAAPPTWTQKLWPETWAATRLVVQFMALAFLLEALIVLYVPQALIIGLLGSQNQWAVPLAALLGVPVYTSNLTALPLISGLLEQGMSGAAALAFLIAGPTTTLPAMAAVWGLVRRRVFGLYVTFSLIGALLLGLVYALVG